MSDVVFSKPLRACLAIAIVCSVGAGCARDIDPKPEGIASAWQRRDAAVKTNQSQQLRSHNKRTPGIRSKANLTNTRKPIPHGLANSLADPPATFHTTDITDTADIIATVNGQAIARSQIVDLLLRGHGPGLLNQLAVYEQARALAADRGLGLSSVEVQREYSSTLNRLANPLVSISTNQVDRQEAQAVLDEVLAERNISREEFDLTIRRNALLRKLTVGQLHFTQAQIKAEHALMIARKAEVRHIQLATHAELSHVLARLARGEDFADVARRFSANTASAPRGGLLVPFAEQDDRVPNLMRKTAFDLQPGQQADPIRMGAWYHIVKLVRILPEEPSSNEPTRDEIEARLQDRLADAAMQQLYGKLLKEADIEIHDPILRQAYEHQRGKSSR